MKNDFLVNIYLFCFKCIASFCRLFALKPNKILIIATFPENNQFLLRALSNEKDDHEVIVVCSEKLKKELSAFSGTKTYVVKNINFINPAIIYHLMTAKKIVVDNYFAFLSAVTFKENAECIQIWHANGAIKKFGFADHSTELRSEQAVRRFGKVYDNFHKIVVGSDLMKDIFQKAFLAKEDRFLFTGMPRTDTFFQASSESGLMERLKNKIDLRGRKIILYAPTYRDNEINDFKIQLDLEMMNRKLSKDYVLLIKLHPAVNSGMLNNPFPSFVCDISMEKNINDILKITDILITDYSSIPFEFSILERPMIFYAYDLETYTRDRGLWESYDKMVCGPIAKDTASVVDNILNEQFNADELNAYKLKWNQYNTGNASGKLAKYLLGHNK